MASPDSLTEDKRQILQELQVFDINKTITGITDVQNAMEILESNRWDLQRSIESVLDRDFAANAQDDYSAPLLPEASSIRNAGTPNRTTRHVGRPAASLFSMLTTPILWGLKFVWSILSYTRKLCLITVSFVPFFKLSRTIRNRSSNPKDVAIQFQRKFDQRFGDKGPRFYEGSYTQALDNAKQNLKYLLVVLHSEDHDDTERFCRETLTSDQFVSYLHQSHIIVWGGDVKENEAFKVSSMLGATGYPFMGFIALHENRMKVIYRFEGIIDSQGCIDVLDRLIQKMEPTYATARAERAEREASRSIREQQDSAYERSLRADREKAEKARKEEELQKQQLQIQKSAELELERRKQVHHLNQAKLERKQELAANLTEEPDSGDIAKINVRLPNGKRLIRKFDATAPIQVY